MGAQLSLKAALALTKRIATASDRCSKTRARTGSTFGCPQIWRIMTCLHIYMMFMDCSPLYYRPMAKRNIFFIIRYCVCKFCRDLCNCPHLLSHIQWVFSFQSDENMHNTCSRNSYQKQFCCLPLAKPMWLIYNACAWAYADLCVRSRYQGQGQIITPTASV